jgi:hypothetical protein
MLAAMMERRIPVNYRLDPDLLGSYLPAPFRARPRRPTTNERIKAAAPADEGRAALAGRSHPGSAELTRQVHGHVPNVRVRATMASWDAPSLPTGMMGRDENLAASAEVLGRAAGCGVRVVVTGESADAPGAPRHDAIHERCRSSSGAIGAFPIACGAGLRR